MKKWGCRQGNLFYRKRFEVQQFQRKVPILWSNGKNYKRKSGNDVVGVRTFELQFSVESACREGNDKQGEEVLSRLQKAHSDLEEADVVYNAQCNSNFRTGKQMPQTFLTHHKKILKREKYFTQVDQQMTQQKADSRQEKNRKQTSIADLVCEMKELCGEDSTYSVVHLKRKIKEYVGKSIMYTEKEGKPSVLTFSETFGRYCTTFITVQRK